MAALLREVEPRLVKFTEYIELAMLCRNEHGGQSVHVGGVNVKVIFKFEMM